MGFIFRNCEYFSNNSLRNLFISLIRSKLEYCSEIWSPNYNKYIAAIEKIQMKFFKFICYKDKREYHRNDYESELLSFNLQKLHDRRIINDCILVFKIINKKFDSNFLLSQVKHRNHNYNIRKFKILFIEHCNNNTTQYSTLNRAFDHFNKYSYDIDAF